MPKIDRDSISLWEGQLHDFVWFYNELYKQFEKTSSTNFTQDSWIRDQPIGIDYQGAKRICANLHLQGLAKVYSRKPKVPEPLPLKATGKAFPVSDCLEEYKRKQGAKYVVENCMSYCRMRSGERCNIGNALRTLEKDMDVKLVPGENETIQILARKKRVKPRAYIEAFPTELGFKTFREGGYCSIQPQSFLENGRLASGPDKIGIGEGFIEYKELLENHFETAFARFHVAMSRQWDWTEEFRDLYNRKLIDLKKEEAIKLTEDLVLKLAATLPKRRNRSVEAIKAELAKNVKLELTPAQ